MSGSAIIDMPTLFVSVLALLLLWDTVRTTVVIVAQLVSLAWMWRYHRDAR